MFLGKKQFKLVYAPIQLRFCNFRIRDGQSFTGTANPTFQANPTVAPTVSPTGGGSTGGNLQIGLYYVMYTDLLVLGEETLPAPESLQFTVAAGDIPTVTMPAVPSGVTLRRIYLTPPNGASGSETLYATFTAATTFNLNQPYEPGGGIPPDINTTGSYPVGTQTMNVIFDRALQVGQQFTFARDPDPKIASSRGTGGVYTVVSHTETLGATTSITFTPPTDVITFPGTIITIGPHVLRIKIGEGNLTYDEKQTIVYIRDRSLLYTVRFGDDEPVSVKFEFIWEFLSAVGGSGLPTVEDALKRQGEAANWVTSSIDPCEPYCVDIEVEYVPDCPGVEREIFLFKDFRWETLAHDIKQASVSVTGKCNILKIQDTRAA